MTSTLNPLPAGFATRRSATTAATATRTTATTTATAGVTAASATTTAAVAAKATTAACARFTRTCFIHRQSPAAQLSAIQGRHRLIRIAVIRHFDKRKTARLSCFSVLHDLDALHLTVCGKCRIKILLGRLERNVPDINILQDVLLSWVQFGWVQFGWLPFGQIDSQALISAR